MVVLVTGASGQLGQAIRAVAPAYPAMQVCFAGSEEADITNAGQLSGLFARLKPAFCINAAAYTAVDKAESDQDKAFAVNVQGARNLAETCRDFQTTLIHISTDFVFDGTKTTPYTEADPVNPQGIYGLTKLQGEQEVQKTLPRHYIVRTSWLYSGYGHNFMKTMLRLAQERPELGVVNDQTGTPTHASDLARALLDIIQSGKNAYGVYHYSNEGEASWYDFAKKIFETYGISINLKAIPTSAYPTPARRPVYSVLDKRKIKAVFGLTIPRWEESLVRHKGN